MRHIDAEQTKQASDGRMSLIAESFLDTVDLDNWGCFAWNFILAEIHELNQ